MNANEKVIEVVDPTDRTSGNQPVTILTFPPTWDMQKCIEYSHKKNLNPFVLGMTDDGSQNKFKCAYSWRLSYYNQFGNWPDGY